MTKEKDMFVIVWGVVSEDGQVPFSNLAEEIFGFRGIEEKELRRIIKEELPCLKIKRKRHREVVVYDRKSESYTRNLQHIPEIERTISGDITTNTPTQALYKEFDRINDSSCPIGIPWKHIPKIYLWPGKVSCVQSNCDYRCFGTNSCTGSCGVKKDLLTKFTRT